MTIIFQIIFQILSSENTDIPDLLRFLCFDRKSLPIRKITRMILPIQILATPNFNKSLWGIGKRFGVIEW